MAFPNKYFQGAIDGKNANNFIKQLDFTLGLADRIKLVESLLNPNGKVDSYFQVYFDEKFNPHLNKSDYLSSENNVCKTLESIANYLLFADDAIKVKKTEYNYYTTKQLKNKFGGELSVDEFIDKTYSEISDENINILVKNKNYKLPIEQNLTKEDIENILYIHQYEESKAVLYTKLKQLKALDTDKALQIKIIKHIKQIKTDQLYIKDQVKGTIYFKTIAKGSTKPEYDVLEFSNKKQVIELLRCSNNILTGAGCLKLDLKTILRTMKFTELEYTILNYLINGSSSFDISKMLNYRHIAIQDKIGSIVRNIVKTYNRDFSDYYYTYIAKGKYKNCNTCKKPLLLTEDNYYIDARNADGFKNCCRMCLKWKREQKDILENS